MVAGAGKRTEGPVLTTPKVGGNGSIGLFTRPSWPASNETPRAAPGSPAWPLDNSPPLPTKRHTRLPAASDGICRLGRQGGMDNEGFAGKVVVKDYSPRPACQPPEPGKKRAVAGSRKAPGVYALYLGTAAHLFHLDRCYRCRFILNRCYRCRTVKA